MLKSAAERGVKVHVIVYKEVQTALTLNSAHTKSTLEALHPNISVFRHPNHAPSSYDMNTELGANFTAVQHEDLAKASVDAVTALYGSTKDTVLFWAHHEKLIVVDRKVGFIGGLDLCFGRWDTNSHPIADVHPGNLDAIIFPGHDYNNARVLDFANVNNWGGNKLDRTKSSRMGWSDVAISMNGPILESLITHFSDRWNFIFSEKYKSREPCNYATLRGVGATTTGQALKETAVGYINNLTRSSDRGRGLDALTTVKTHIPCIQLVRSCSKWSSGLVTEHSIANAYVAVIENAEHFVYIENQFFITATSDQQHPIVNKIGATIAQRIIKSYKTGQNFKVIVIMPAVPAFAGHLKSDNALGTRAIMEFQYKSICRGGYSIVEQLREAGIEDTRKYISFYNLRNFDRINTGQTMQDTQQISGVYYEDARTGHDKMLAGSQYVISDTEDALGQYHEYQRQAVNALDFNLDTISSCYMGGAHTVLDIPWDGEAEDEIASFVSEELYVHSKLLIADDRVAICGSANLNDRSQLGYHDSEIAVVIEGGESVDSFMDGKPYKVTKFASSLRRQIFRKHLGLLRDQRWDRPDKNWHHINRSGNVYDWGTPADVLVRDPMNKNFQDLWDKTADTNTEVFRRAFHPVPDDRVRTWVDYNKFFEKHFLIPGNKNKGNVKSNDEKVEYGHIVRKEFPGGVNEVKAWLSRIRGSLVHMPLDFLADEDDIAKQGWKLNGVTEMLYT